MLMQLGDPYHMEVKAEPSSKRKRLSRREVWVFVLHASEEASTC